VLIVILLGLVGAEAAYHQVTVGGVGGRHRALYTCAITALELRHATVGYLTPPSARPSRRACSSARSSMCRPTLTPPTSSCSGFRRELSHTFWASACHTNSRTIVWRIRPASFRTRLAAPAPGWSAPFGLFGRSAGRPLAAVDSSRGTAAVALLAVQKRRVRC
jgi:hypothetical protein